jgi:predicted DNA-binding ribbon-helix-helix protein
MSEDAERKAAEVVESIAETVKTSVTLTRDLWQQIKIEAIKRGLTFAQVVEAALRKWLELEEEERKKT